jgi:predicted PurR-regulated permease PerM
MVDGRKLVNFLRRNSFFQEDQTEQLLSTLAGMCRSVILAAVASGLAQSLLEAIACVVTGTPNVALIGALVFLGSFVPLIGSAPVTIFVAVQQLLIGRTGAGIALAIAALLVGLVDNVVRPWVIRGSANLHPLLAFVAAFGGLQMLGFSGVFLGPIIAGFAVVLIRVLVQGDSAPSQDLGL